MRTEYGAQMAKDFDRTVLIEMADAALARAKWCQSEMKRMADSDLWSREDVKDLKSDCEVFNEMARALKNVADA